MLTALVQAIINGIGALGGVLDNLPLCPFHQVNAVVLDSQLLSMLAWFVPFDAIISLLQTWLVSIAGWYVAKTGLRWKRIIQ